MSRSTTPLVPPSQDPHSDDEAEPTLLPFDFLYPDQRLQWKVIDAAPDHADQRFNLECQECETSKGLYHCEDCGSSFCEKCTDLIHTIRGYSSHTIRHARVGDPGFQKEEVETYPDARHDPYNHIYAGRTIPSRTQEAPVLNQTIRTSHLETSKFQVGENVIFVSSELGRPDTEDRRERTGTIVQSGIQRGSDNASYYRVLWARGVVHLESCFYQANLTFEDAWPIEVKQYVNQYHAIKAVAVAEETARRIWRRERYAGREKDAFSTDDALVELMEAVDADVEKAAVEIDAIRTNDDFLDLHRQGRQLPIPLLLDRSHPEFDTPYQPHGRIRYLLLAEEDLESLDEARPRKMRQIFNHMLFNYLGFVMERWKSHCAKTREAAIRAQRKEAIEVIEDWYFQFLPRAKTSGSSPPRKQASLVPATSAADLAALLTKQGRPMLLFEQYFEQMLHQYKRDAWDVWRANAGPTQSYPLAPTLWHPSLDIQLPILPNLWSSTTHLGKLTIQDLAKFKQMKLNHQGPTDSSNWIIRTRVAQGGYPEGQAYRDQKVVARSDSISCLLLQNIGTFVCLMTPEELQRHEEESHQVNQESSDDITYSYQRLIQKRHERLVLEHENAIRATETYLQQCDRAIAKFELEIINDEDERNAQEDEANLEQLIVKQKLALEKHTQAKQAASMIAPKVDHVFCPLEPDKASTHDTLTRLMQELELRLRRKENFYIFSQHGHGRVGMVGAILLARLYGLAPRDALDRNQRYHDCRWIYQKNVMKKQFMISSPQSMAQVQMVHQVLASTDANYAQLITRSEEQKTPFYSRQQQRGVPVKYQDGFVVNKHPTPEEAQEQSQKQYQRIKLGKREARASKLRRRRMLAKLESHQMHVEDLQSKLLDRTY